MAKIQAIIKDIEALDPEELEEILQFLLKKTQKGEQVKMKLEKYRGKGRGVWQEDAQVYVNQLRRDDLYN